MLLPSQLNEISRQYSAYVEEMREFLLHEGFPVNSPGAVAALATRLREDTQFGADVSSLVRAVMYRERERIGYMELLGILVVAAAGTRGAGAQDEAMRETLRFLMKTRRPLYGDRGEEESAVAEAESVRGAAVAAQPIEMMPAVDSVETRRLSETDDETPMAFLAAAEGEAPWWRTHAVWVVGFLGVMLGLGAGLMIRHGESAAKSGSAAVVATDAASGAPAVRQSPVLRGRSVGRSRKPSPAVTPVREREASVAASGARTGAAGRATGIAGAAAGASGSTAAPQPMETSAGRRPQPVLTAAQGHMTEQGRVTDRGTLLAEFAHPAARGAVVSPVMAAPANTPGGSAAMSTPREGVVRSGSAGIMAGNVWFSPAPMYPPAASAAGVEGEVTVRAVVGRDGDVVDARVVSGPPLLRDAALQAVEQWRYRPYMQDGKPVAVATTAIVDFQMPK